MAPGANLDSALNLLMGAYYAQYLAGEPFGMRWPEAEVDVVLAGLRDGRRADGRREKRCPEASMAAARGVLGKRGDELDGLRLPSPSAPAGYLITAIVSPAATAPPSLTFSSSTLPASGGR